MLRGSREACRAPCPSRQKETTYLETASTGLSSPAHGRMAFNTRRRPQPQGPVRENKTYLGLRLGQTAGQEGEGGRGRRVAGDFRVCKTRPVNKPRDAWSGALTPYASHPFMSCIAGRRLHLPCSLPAFLYLRLGDTSAHDQRSLPRPISPPSPLSSSPCFPTLRPTIPPDNPPPALPPIARRFSLWYDDGLRELWLREASVSTSPFPLHLGNHHCRPLAFFQPHRVPHLHIAAPSSSHALPQSSPQTRMER